MKKRIPLSFLAALIVAMGCASAKAQTCEEKLTLPEYVDCEVKRLVRERLMQSDDTRQAEAPAASQNSTTLVNRSSAPDTVGMSFTPNTLATRSRASKSTDMSVTVSLYALYALVTSRNPYNENFYEDNTSRFRRISFAFGRSFPEGKTAVPAQGSYTYQGKFVLTKSRDVGDPSNTKQLRDLVDLLKQTAGASVYGTIFHEIQKYLYDQVGGDKPPKAEPPDAFITLTRKPDELHKMFAQLTKYDRAKIDAIIEESIQSQGALLSKTEEIIRDITRRTQIAFAFTARISKGIGANLYREELIFDKPLFGTFSGTVNTSYDFQNALSKTGLNRHIGRFVGAIQTPLGKSSWLPSKKPFSIGVSGEGDWGTNGTPIYRAQFKLTIPIVAGLNLPLSFTYANRTSVPLADVKGQMGIVADFGKLSKAFATN